MRDMKPRPEDEYPQIDWTRMAVALAACASILIISVIVF